MIKIPEKHKQEGFSTKTAWGIEGFIYEGEGISKRIKYISLGIDFEGFFLVLFNENKEFIHTLPWNSNSECMHEDEELEEYWNENNIPEEERDHNGSCPLCEEYEKNYKLSNDKSEVIDFVWQMLEGTKFTMDENVEIIE